MVTSQVVQRTWFCERRGCWSSLNSALRRDVRVLAWIECKFVLLFWVLYVTSPANFQKFVSRPFINITSEINSLCLSLWLREAHQWWSLKLMSQLFLRLRSLLMERVEKYPKPVNLEELRKRPCLKGNSSSKFSAHRGKIPLLEMFDCVVYDSFDVRVIW